MSESRPTLQYATPPKRDGLCVHEIVETSLYVLAAAAMLVLGMIGVRRLSMLFLFPVDRLPGDLIQAFAMTIVGIVLFIGFGWQAGAPGRRKSLPAIDEPSDRPNTQ